MGTSTDASIGFGIAMEDGFEFPWDIINDEEEEDYEDDEYGDYEKWWRRQNNFSNPYSWQDDKYWEYQRNWDLSNPLPFDLENCCSGDYPVYVLLVPGTCQTARRGYPESFDPKILKVEEAALNRFLEFIKKYEIPFEEPKWLLFSYWG